MKCSLSFFSFQKGFQSLPSVSTLETLRLLKYSHTYRVIIFLLALVAETITTIHCQEFSKVDRKRNTRDTSISPSTLEELHTSK